MNGRPQKRSFSIKGHRTSISLEPQFWEALKSASAEERISLSAMINRIDNNRVSAGLSSAVRVYLLQRLEAKVVGDDSSAGPGPGVSSNSNEIRDIHREIA